MYKCLLLEGSNWTRKFRKCCRSFGSVAEVWRFCFLYPLLNRLWTIFRSLRGPKPPPNSGINFRFSDKWNPQPELHPSVSGECHFPYYSSWRSWGSEQKKKKKFGRGKEKLNGKMKGAGLNSRYGNRRGCEVYAVGPMICRESNKIQIKEQEYAAGEGSERTRKQKWSEGKEPPGRWCKKSKITEIWKLTTCN